MALSYDGNNCSSGNRASYCKGLPNEPICMNRATLENGFCRSCNDKPKVGETWFVKLPKQEIVSDLQIKKFFKKCVLFDGELLYKIDDVEFIEKVIFE